jgi:adiponectin receptor
LPQTIWRFDYAGIVILIVASFVPFVYFSFLCDVLLRNVYLITTCSLGMYLFFLPEQ